MSVRLDIAERVARIVIDRPDRMNAIDAATETELEAVWQEPQRRDDVSCIVLT